MSVAVWLVLILSDKLVEQSCRRRFRVLLQNDDFARNLLRRRSPDVRRPHAELRTKEIAEMG